LQGQAIHGEGEIAILVLAGVTVSMAAFTASSPLLCSFARFPFFFPLEPVGV
jgi:hypothetical protein